MQAGKLKIIGRVLLLSVLASQADAGGFQLDLRARKQIDAEAQRMVDEQLTPGIAIGIMSQGKLIYANGFGLSNIETCTKVSPTAVFGIASVAKQFTAAGIVSLMEQGKIDLDDRLARFFPDFPRGDEVTIKQLITHTSGIHSPGHNPEQDAKLRTTADVVALIQNQPALYDFEPGTAYRYSNASYILLGAIIEQLFDGTYGDFLQNLLTPAETTSTAFDNEREIVFNRVSAYDLDRNTNELIHAPVTAAFLSIGAAGIRSTVIDLLRWQDALLGGRIISADGVRAMTTQVTDENGQALPGSARGLGGILGADNGHAFFSADGGGPGAQSSLKVYLDDDVAFAVLANVTEARVEPGMPDNDAVTTMKAFLSDLIAGPSQATSSARLTRGLPGLRHPGPRADERCRKAAHDNP